MRFIGAFVCGKCGKEFTIELGPQKMGELRTPKKIGVFVGQLSEIMARSCAEHEGCCNRPSARSKEDD